MMERLFVGWLPLILTVASPVAYVILSIRKVKNKSTIPLGKSASILFLLGLVLPVLATILSMYSVTYFEPGIKCLTGFVGFAPFGWFLTIFIIPITYVISSSVWESKHPNDLISPDRVDIYNTGLYKKPTID